MLIFQSVCTVLLSFWEGFVSGVSTATHSNQDSRFVVWCSQVRFPRRHHRMMVIQGTEERFRDN